MEVAMERSLIAIVGSVDPQRAYDPPLDNVELPRQACVDLGRELANERCGLIVYSASEGFIEPGIVSGYVNSGKAEDGSIQVRSPYGGTAADFAEAREHPSSSTFDRTAAAIGKSPTTARWSIRRAYCSSAAEGR